MQYLDIPILKNYCFSEVEITLSSPSFLIIPSVASQFKDFDGAYSARLHNSQLTKADTMGLSLQINNNSEG